MAEPNDWKLVRGETLDDVVHRDVRRATDQDAKSASDELEDEFDEGVGFACLRPVSLSSSPDGRIGEDPRQGDHG